jgi:hypothetical protein
VTVPGATIWQVGDQHWDTGSSRSTGPDTAPGAAVFLIGHSQGVSSGGGREGPDSCGALFTSSPRVELAWQRASGHNISLHRVARACHLRAIAFFDEALSRA